MCYTLWGNGKLMAGYTQIKPIIGSNVYYVGLPTSPRSLNFQGNPSYYLYLKFNMSRHINNIYF